MAKRARAAALLFGAALAMGLGLSAGCGSTGGDATEGGGGPERLAVSVLLAGKKTAVLGEAPLDDGFQPSPAPLAGEVDVIRWELKDSSGAVQARGDIGGARLVRSELHDENGAAVHWRGQSDVATLALELPNIDGELFFFEGAPAVASAGTQSLRPRAQDGIALLARAVVKRLGGGYRSDVLRSPTPAPLKRVSGDCGGRMNLLFVPEGFTEAELPAYRSRVSELASQLMAIDVYRDHMKDMTIWSAEIASKESGISDPGCRAGEMTCPKDTSLTMRDTAFGTWYGDGKARSRRCVLPSVTDLDDLTAWAEKARLVWQIRIDHTIMIVNAPGKLGCADSQSMAIGREVDGAVLAHEIGHALGQLSDEYVDKELCTADTVAFADSERKAGRFAVGKNISLSPNRQDLPWKDFVLPSTPLPTTDPSPTLVGAYEGGFYCEKGFFRAQHDCKMDDEHKPFCAVCRKAMNDAFAGRAARAPRDGSICPIGERDAGAPPTDASTASDGSAAKVGTLAMLQAPTYWGASAMLSDPPFKLGCTRTMGAACEIADCPQPPPSYTPHSAGPITITGGLLPAQGVTISPEANGLYIFKQFPGKAWNGGEDIFFDAPGAAVPAFRVKGVAPMPASWVSPALPPAGTPLTISRGTPLAMQWSGGSGKVSITLTADKTPLTQGTVELHCFFDASAGSGTIPAADLQNLPVSPAPLGNPAASGQLSAGLVSVTTTQVADWSIATSLSAPLMSGNEAASARLVIQ